MSGAHLASLSTSFDVPLTVTAVSMRLGISPSTLRTWERRYGLGPDDRAAGAHRRYLAADIERLTAMVDLVRAGVSPADAAATILALPKAAAEHDQTQAPHTVDELIDSSCRCRVTELRRGLEAAVKNEGLVYTWSKLVAPALDSLRADEHGELPGCAPSNVLRTAFRELLAQVAQEIPQRESACATVALFTDLTHEVGAHVVGVELRRYGINARVIATERLSGKEGPQRLKAMYSAYPVDLAIVMGTGSQCQHFVEFLAADCQCDVIIVGSDAPHVLNGRVVWVRTLAACIEEAVAALSAPEGAAV